VLVRDVSAGAWSGTGWALSGSGTRCERQQQIDDACEQPAGGCSGGHTHGDAEAEGNEDAEHVVTLDERWSDARTDGGHVQLPSLPTTLRAHLEGCTGSKVTRAEEGHT
jgi:hypothetical protein